jgi:hypothetical protein
MVWNRHFHSYSYSSRTPTLRHWSWRVGSAWMEKEAESCLAGLISFDLAGCTSVHDVDKFPLKSLWRIHHQQHLDLLGDQSVRRARYSVFFGFHNSATAANLPWRGHAGLATCIQGQCIEGRSIQGHSIQGHTALLPHSLLPSCLWTPKRREIFSWFSPIISSLAPMYSSRSNLEIPGIVPPPASAHRVCSGGGGSRKQR